LGKQIQFSVCPKAILYWESREKSWVARKTNGETAVQLNHFEIGNKRS